MSKKRRSFSAEFKFRVALEAAKGAKTINELASEHGVHPSQISQWKRELLDEGSSIFSNNATRQQRDQGVAEAELYEQIGRLKMQLEWLKKKLPDSVETKRAMIEFAHTQITVRRQCELLGLNRSTAYYKPTAESPLNLKLMRLIDEQYTKTPFYGYPRFLRSKNRA